MSFKLFCLTSNIITRRQLISLSQRRFIKLQPVSAPVQNVAESFEEKNAKLKRPLSPHLTIYKPQLTSMMSISHRIAGCVLVGYMLVIAGSSVVYDLNTLISFIQSLQLSPTTLFAAKTVFALPVAYHISNGIRHLIWDIGFGLTIKSVYISGYVTLLLTGVLSVLMGMN